MKQLTRRISMLLVVAFAVSLTACTIIRYVDENDDENDNTVTNSPTNTEPEPAVVDLLVFVELTRGSSGMMNDYAAYIGLVEAALIEMGVTVRKVAVAPLYRQQSHRPALIYGRGSPDNYSQNLDETLEYYVTEQGLDEFDGTADAPGENPAALGMNLDEESIYNPEQASSGGRAYFEGPEDGFAVFHLTGTARSCDHNAPECTIDQQLPADYFTASNEANIADWLVLPGGGLPPGDIIHVSINTEENVDYDTFTDQCTSQPNFPTAYLDFIEPSEEHAYYEPFTSELEEGAGHGREVDLCEAFSSEAGVSAVDVASDIAETVR